jgi:3-oxoacyl-[acyl-carrier protein] reductase
VITVQSGKYVLITGGDRGIGRAIAYKFAKSGYYTIFTYNKCLECAKETLENIRGMGSDGFFIKIDLGNPDNIKRAYNEISRRIPHLNVLINNAGIVSFGNLEELSINDWKKVIDINLTGAFIMTKTFLPLLRKAGKASIINIASIAGQTGNVYASSAYCASKAGLIGFTKRIAIELAPHIRVNAIAPSFVETDMVSQFINTEEKRKKVAELHPLKDIGKPEDIAEAAYFLASETSRFITGHILNVNGGRYT